MALAMHLVYSLTSYSRKDSGTPSKRKPVPKRLRKSVEYAKITGTCCFKVIDSDGNCDIIEPGGDKKPKVLTITKIFADECTNLEC